MSVESITTSQHILLDVTKVFIADGTALAAASVRGGQLVPA